MDQNEKDSLKKRAVEILRETGREMSGAELLKALDTDIFPGTLATLMGELSTGGDALVQIHRKGVRSRKVTYSLKTA